MAEWKEVYLSEDYVVSNEGEVARVKDGLILKQYPQKSGYVNVWLRLPYGNKSFPVHRLVCIAFHGIEGYKQGLFVDHIDTNRANNHADNLRWVTPKENSNNPLTLKKRRKMVTEKDYKEFVSLVKRMREAQDMANLAMTKSDDYSVALIYINKAEELEKEVDEYLKKM